MKKSNFIWILAFLGIAVSCSKSTEQSSDTNNAEASVEKNLMTSATVEKPKGLITIEEAQAQLKKYQTAHPGVNADQYALRTWISIEELENYIAYVKEESAKKNIKVTGIDFIHTQKKESKPGMANKGNSDYELTLMYAPTYLDSQSGKNLTFDPMNSTDGKPALLSELLKDSTESKDSADGKSGQKNGKGSGIGNNIFSCPNVCP